MPLRPRKDPRILRAASTVNEELQNRAILHSIFLQRYKAGQVRQVVGFLNQDVLPDLLGQISSELAKVTDKRTTTTKLSRLEESLTVFNETLRGGFGKAHQTFADEMRGLARTEAEWQQFVVQETVPFDVGFSLPSQKVLERVVSKEPIHGRLLEDWFNDLSASAEKKIEQQLRIGIVEGETIDEMIKRVRGTGGVADQSRNQTAAVVRTTVQNVATNAREATYEENEDVVDKVRYVAVLDSRTTLRCASLDGRIFEIDEGPRPPQHFGCRSTTVPVLKSWEELGIKGLKELPPATRATMDGQVPDTLTFPEWLKSQPFDTQEDVLGTERAILFRQGKVKFEKFIDDQGRTLTLKELRRRERLK